MRAARYMMRAARQMIRAELYLCRGVKHAVPHRKVKPGARVPEKVWKAGTTLVAMTQTLANIICSSINVSLTTEIIQMTNWTDKYDNFDR
jgi:hypothetical protein